MSESLSRAMLIEELAKIPSGGRGALLQAAASFTPRPRLEAEIASGSLRARLANYWERRFDEPIATMS